MVFNMFGGGSAETYDATVAVGSTASSITFPNIPKEPKSWALYFYPRNGATLSGIGATSAILAYVKGGDLDAGIVTTSSSISNANTITSSYNSGDEEFTLTAGGSDKFYGGSDMNYRIIYTN